MGLVVRDFEDDGGGGGRGGPVFDEGMGGRGLAACGRAWGAMAKMRFKGLGSVGEPAGETGESGPLAVLALLLEPADEGAESRLGLLGAGEVPMEG